MKNEATLRISARRSWSIVPAMVAAGVALIAIGAAYATSGSQPAAGPVRGRVVIEGAAPTTEDWGFVLNADVAQVLRHRPGLEPADIVRTHAFGWEGLTVDELLSNPVLVRELRLQPQLSPIDLIRLEARGS